MRHDATAATMTLLSLVAAAAPLCAQSPPVAQVRGTVFDSVAMAPLRGALVRIVRADDPSMGRSTTTDSLGAYVHDSVPAGVWLASFLHPSLDSLRLEPGIVRVEISEAGVVTLPLTTPSGQALVVQACGPAGAEETGVITGSIRNADDEMPIAGAVVEVEWPEWVLAKRKLVTEQSRLRAVSDATGSYRICGVPSGSTLRARSWVQADSAGVVEVVVPASGYTVQDFDIGASPTPATATTGTPPTVGNGETFAVRRGTAVVRGRITTAAGAPLPDAIVRVIGSGTEDRTSATGEFRVADAVAGTQTIEARAIGYSPVRQAVRLRSSGELEVRLTLAPRNVELDTVRVVAGREIPWDVRGIERRWRTGMGKFMDGKTIADRATMYATDALRGMPGVFVRMANQQFGNQIYMRSNTGTECLAQVWIDGMQFRTGGRVGSTLDDMVNVRDIAAIELYNRPTMVPAEYMTMGNGCGVVAVWTKLGTGNIPILPPKSSR